MKPEYLQFIKQAMITKRVPSTMCTLMKEDTGKG